MLEIPKIEDEIVSKDGSKLLQYQMNGVQFLLNRFSKGSNSILADESLLGKKVQIAALIEEINKKVNQFFPVLIITNEAAFTKWNNEFNNWSNIKFTNAADSETVKKYIDGRKDQNDEVNLIITSDAFLENLDIIKEVTWMYIVVHEVNFDQELIIKVQDHLQTFIGSCITIINENPFISGKEQFISTLKLLDPTIFDAAKLETIFDDADAEKFQAKVLPQIFPYILCRKKGEVETVF